MGELKEEGHLVAGRIWGPHRRCARQGIAGVKVTEMLPEGREDDTTELNGGQTTGGLKARPRAFPEIMGSHGRDIRALKC